MKKNNLIKIKYEGLNWNYFQNQVLSLGIIFYNLNKNDYKNITFSFARKDYITITKNDKLKNYKLQIVERSGFQKLKHDFMYRLGACIGFFVMLVGVFSVSRLTLNYNIYGTNIISKNEVVDKIEEFGIKKGAYNTFKNEDLENYLLSNLNNVSLVSVSQKGNTICVNIKEKDSENASKNENITSNNNLIIKSIDVLSGTPLCKVGDVVTPGKDLVGAYTIVDGRRVSCPAIAKISAEVWWVGSVRFESEKTILSRTGNRKTFSFVSWNDKTLLSDSIEPPYEVYEIAHSCFDLTGNFLPLTCTKVTFYDCEKKVIKQNLEESRDILLHESRLLAYNKVPNYINITNEEQKIVSRGNDIFIQTYLTAIMEITNVGE